MAKELVYRLNNPNYTIYHRAALGGLAATIRAWGNNKPAGIDAELKRDFARLSWGDELEDQEALKRILAASFKLTDDKLIDLPGQAIKDDQYGLRLAIHSGLISTFLQHPKMRPTIEKEARRIEIKTADDEAGVILTYRTVDSFAHQKSQGTGLINDKLKGRLPDTAIIPQSMVPGAMKGMGELSASADEIILLHYLIVGSAVFLLRSYNRNFQEKAQACIVIPDVTDLIAFAKALEKIAIAGTEFQRFRNSYLGRVVGGAEEAALRFLIDLQTDRINEERSVAGCQVVAMGKVAWDANQINRSISVKLRTDYPEMDVFRAAYMYLSKSKVIKPKDGSSMVIPSSPLPELIAANLAAERHWCSYFTKLVSDKKEFERLRFSQGGLKAMKESVKDEDDQIIIKAFHEAWRFTLGALNERAETNNLKKDRLFEVERERVRNAILRAKSSEAMANWFLRFCADSTKGGSLPTMRKEPERIRKLIFNPRNFERFQNLCLFALVSYSSESNKTISQGEK